MRIVVLPTVGMILLACVASGGTSTGTGPVLAGAYELNSVNGTPMPATLSASGNDTTYLEEELLIASPGGNYQTAGVTVTDGPSIFGQPVQFASSGTYSARCQHVDPGAAGIEAPVGGKGRRDGSPEMCRPPVRDAGLTG